MSGTRSPFPTEPATEPRSALIVAHGQPSDPDPAEAALAALARAVAAHLPGWALRSATLAKAQALEATVAGLRAPLIYPLFMADGWFTQTALPQRLQAAGAARARQLPPLGLDPEFNDLAAQVAVAAARQAGIAQAACTLILAAHGGNRTPNPARAAAASAAVIAAATGFGDIRLGFLEQSPFLADIARGAGPAALCLPLFAAGGGHVSHDVPTALQNAGFAGRLLPSLGAHREIPGLIARALAAAAA